MDAIDATLGGAIDEVIDPLTGERMLGAFEPEDESGGVAAADVVEVAVAIDVHDGGVNHLHAFHEERGFPIGRGVKDGAELLGGHLVGDDVELAVAGEVAGHGGPVFEALSDDVALPERLGLVPINPDVAGGAAAGNHFGKAVVVEVGDHQVLAGHAAGIKHFGLFPLAIGLTLIQGHADGGAAPPTGNEFVAAIAIEVAPAERVAFEDLALNHFTGPSCGGESGGELGHRTLRIHLGGGLFIDGDTVAVIGLDTRQNAAHIDVSQLHFAGLAIAEALAIPLLPSAGEREEAVFAADDQLVIDAQEVVRFMQRFVGDLDGPSVLAGVRRNAKDEYAQGCLVPLRRFGEAAVQRQRDQFGTSIAIDIHKSQAMQRGLGTDPGGGPKPIDARVAQPMERAAADGIARLPVAGQGDIEPAIAVDIVDRHRHVVFGRHLVGNDMLLPSGVLIPNHLRVVDGDDVGQFVAVDVGDLDGVDDAKVLVNFLGTKVLPS